jgi:PAS domain S-box-containing protein
MAVGLRRTIPPRGASRAPRRAAWAALLLGLVQAAQSAPMAAEPRLTQLGAARWGVEAGLGGAWVRDIAESPDGFLWIATSNGLARFDGRRFQRFDAVRTPGLPHSGMTALAVGTDGRLWIGLEFGGLRTLRDGVVAAAPEAASLPEAALVRDILRSSDDGIWVGTDRGLWRIGPGGAVPVPLGPGAPADVRALAREGDAVWVRTRQHGLWRVESGVARPHPDAPDCLGNSVAAGAGGLFTACSAGIWRWDGGAGRWDLLLAEVGVATLFTDSRGVLWFGTQQGLARWSAGTLERRPPDAALTDWRLRAFHQDSRGDLWLGTFAGGLARLHHGPVRAFGAVEGLGLSASTAVLAVRDEVYVGSPAQGLVRWRPESHDPMRWTQADGLPGEAVWALAQDPRDPGGLWVGGDRGLAWLQDDRLVPSGPGGSRYDGEVRLLYVDPAPPHSLWLSGLSGGAREVQPQGTRVHGPEQGLLLDRVAFFHRDRRGRLLAGGREGLFVHADGRWTQMEVDGLTLRALTAITESAEGELWLASSIDGLIWWSGNDSRAFGDAEGMPFLPVHTLALDERDGLWLSGDDGLARISRREHARWRAGEGGGLPIERLGQRDGLRDAETNGWGKPSVTRIGSGELVYPTLTGVALLDTAWRPSLALAPRDIFVSGAWTGSRALPVAGSLALEPGERALRIEFSALQMRRPEALAFRYQLEGYDPAWIPAERSTEANYGRLVPGNFRFRLQARLPGTDWVEATPGLAVQAKPHFWETAQFKAVLVLLGLAAIWGLFAWRRRIDGRHTAVLAEAGRFLREVIDTSPHPIFARRRDGTYSLANRAAAGIYGLEPGQLEGRTPGALGARLDGMQALDAMDADVIRTGTEHTAPEAEVVDHEGQRRWFRLVKRPRFGPDAVTVEQVIGTAVDITAYRQAVSELRRQEASLQASTAGARRLSQKLLHAQEDERRRLARELHDDLTQRVAGLAMLAWSTLQALERDPGRDVGGNLREVALELERIANEVQTLARDLHPPALDSMGLADALRQDCATFAKRAGMAVSVDCGELPPDLAPDVALAIYRVVQEGLRNVRTHSGVREATVRLQADDAGLHLAIADDGVGFDAGDARQRRGLGLSSLDERARLAGGTLKVHSAPGRGTRLEVHIPWPVPDLPSQAR